jgi:hypothetical protein
VNPEMPEAENFPEFESDDEMRDWFEKADLSAYHLDQALEVVVASHVQLSIGGEEPASSGTTTRGSIGTLREPIRLVRG